jgi:hypothetical protein
VLKYKISTVSLVIMVLLLYLLTSPVAAGSDAGWVTMNPGRMDGEIKSQIWVKGVLYVAGPFNHIAGIEAHCIARWDGVAWSSLGDGVDGTINSIVADKNGIIYAGGLFKSAGGKPALNVAKWDGKNWSALGKGIADEVHAMIFDKEGLLYAGGVFTRTGNNEQAKNVACWNGTEWAGVGTSDYISTASGVFALAVDSANCIYAAGYDFSETCSICYYGMVLKRVNGSWLHIYSKPAPTTGVMYAVKSIQIDRNGTVFISGGALCSLSPGDTKWSVLYDGWDHRVLAVDDSNNVYMQQMNEKQESGKLIKWNIRESSIIGNSFGAIYCASFDSNGTMYVGGSFRNIDSLYTQNLARLDKRQWFTIFPSGFDSLVFWVGCNNGVLYASGDFGPIDTYSKFENLKKWDGNSWVGLPAVPAEYSSSETVDSRGNIYIVKDYEDIFKWDGTEWKLFADVFSLNFVRKLVIDAEDNIYICGGIDSIGVAGASTKIPVSNVARWNGNEWHSIGNELNSYVLSIAAGPVGTVYALAYSNTDSVDHIVKWDGTAWHSIGTVHSINTGPPHLSADRNGNAYICGDYDSIGGISCSCAMWNGSSWRALNKRLRVTYKGQISDNSGNLYVAGEFDSIGDCAAHNIARWNGHEWESLGSGIVKDIYHPYVFMAFDEKINRLYVNQSPEAKYSPYLAAYDFAAGSSINPKPTVLKSSNTISWRVRNSCLVFSGVTVTDRISLYTAAGKLLKTSNGESTIDLKGITSQLLIIRVRSAKNSAVLRMVLKR